MTSQLLGCRTLDLFCLLEINLFLAKRAHLMFDEPEEDTLVVEVMPAVTGKPADSAVFLKVL